MTRILVVDDEPQIVRALRINLRARNYDVDTAPNGTSALQAASRQHPDLIVLDLKTEGYGGHPMKVYVHRRRPEQMSAWLRDAGFTVNAQMVLGPDESSPGAVLIAHLTPGN